MFETRLVICVLVSVVACCAGCGGAEDGRVSVEGLITLDGQPLSGVQVLFDQPELGVNDNKGYTGRTDGEGRYSLRPVMDEGSGAPPGKYRVSLTTAVADPNAPAAPQPPARPTTLFYPESPPPPPERIPPAYRGGKLTFSVPEDGTDKANFELKSK